MLGIIGGMGPAASDLFYEMITEKTHAHSDQENLDLVLISRASMPDRTGAILSKDPARIEDVKGRLLRDAKSLEAMGCGAIAVTCNTAHYFINMIEDQVGIPFVHMIRETAKRLQDTNPGARIAILATDGTIRTGLYQDEFEKHGIEAYTPTPSTQKLVMSEIYNYIKGGYFATAEMWGVIETEIREMGCDGAILACTELSVVKKELKLDDYYLDPMEVMADRCIEIFRGKGEIK